MAFVKTGLQPGDWVQLTRNLETFGGYITKGTYGKITEICERGYSFQDEDGNKVTEVRDGSYFRKLGNMECY